MNLRTVEWIGELDGVLRLIDQTRLPAELVFLECREPESVFEAIRTLRVRGAPAIGVAAAMGTVLGIRDVSADTSTPLIERLKEVSDYLSQARPTAVNLFWALERMVKAAERNAGLSPEGLKRRLLDEAKAVRDEDARMCRAIGRHGAKLIADGDGVLTHCNAGALATAEYGTALAALFAAHEQGKRIRVYADETRPLLQGARLTTWELMRAGIDVTLICDNTAGQVMKEGRVQRVIVGADRIVANGDAANKIGTYSLALLARAHDIPFYVAAPSSTFDLSLPHGGDIPIEERPPEEVTEGFGRRTAPEGVRVYSPAFDVTPHEYIAAIVTERGIVEHPDAEAIRAHLAAGSSGDQPAC